MARLRRPLPPLSPPLHIFYLSSDKKLVQEPLEVKGIKEEIMKLQKVGISLSFISFIAVIVVIAFTADPGIAEEFQKTFSKRIFHGKIREYSE